MKVACKPYLIVIGVHVFFLQYSSRLYIYIYRGVSVSGLVYLECPTRNPITGSSFYRVGGKERSAVWRLIFLCTTAK